MTKLRILLAPLALCLTLGVAHGDDMKPHSALKGHPNLINSEKDLFAAKQAIAKSQTANECVFGLEGGHGQKAKEAIDAAAKQTYDAAEWVNTHAKDCAAYKPAKFTGTKAVSKKAHGALKGHGNLVAAEKNLIGAFDAISRSQEANECVFGLDGWRRREGEGRHRDRVQRGLRGGRVGQHPRERLQGEEVTRRPRNVAAAPVGGATASRESTGRVRLRLERVTARFRHELK